MATPGPKTVFLAPEKIHPAYHDCMRSATSRFIMAIPWFEPNPRMKDEISALLERGVPFLLVARPPSKKGERAALTELMSKQRSVGGKKGILGFGKQEGKDLIEVVLIPNIHAKMVVQDDEAVVVSSANLNTMSQARNTEFGMLSREKDVVRDALQAVEALRASVRCSSTANGGIRECECGGWIFEVNHDRCRVCFKKDKGADARETTEPAPAAEAAQEKHSEPAPEKPKEPPSDPMICPKCGGRKMRKRDRLCRDCYYAEKDAAAS